MEQLSMFVMPLLLMGAMYFMVIRPNNKKKKEDEEMRSKLSVGDEIITLGGIVGRVINIKDSSDSFVIETSVDRSKILVKRWAISSISRAKRDNVQA
ncbi:MAG: preprotein translocase subunit YajC [Oscillospiraceae bacterium]|jgi:preprotein translocase subunit YajC|nr:preprotein translocase subunit YajC [Oscillospiraceae bacterium]